jgi:hypothetical protein
MFKKHISRRTFALRLGSSVLGSSLSFTSLNVLATTYTEQSSLYVSAATDQHSNYFLAILDLEGEQLAKLDLPARAHQIAVNPKTNTLAVAARRPGSYLMVVDSINGKLNQEIHPKTGHHFYGHCAYSSDGRFLFTSENHIESGEGWIFVRDTQENYNVTRSFPSYGIGPHEIKIHPDKETLIVANGGILTHPDSGRAKLNLDTMSPSLVYISIETGELLEQRKLPENLHKLSIRHIDINSNGITAIAMQYQGDKTDDVPLIALHQRGKTIKALWAPEYINRKLENYCGSVCFNTSGSIFAVSAPRGNTITLWDAQNAEFISNLDCSDVCGISKSMNNGFTVSNGLGKLYQLDLKQPLLKLICQDKTISWDNHLTLI